MMTAYHSGGLPAFTVWWSASSTPPYDLNGQGLNLFTAEDALIKALAAPTDEEHRSIWLSGKKNSLKTLPR